MMNSFLQTLSYAFLLFINNFSNSNAVNLECDLTNGLNCNPGCINNKNCSNHVALVLPAFASLMSSENFNINQIPGSSSAIENCTLSFPSHFNIALSKNICSISAPDQQSRNDSLQVTWDFCTISLSIDLGTLIPALIDNSWLLDDLFSTVEQCSNPLSGVKNPPLSLNILSEIAKCLQNLVHNSLNLLSSLSKLNLKGVFNVTLSNIAINAVYTAHKNASSTALFAGFDNQNDIVITKKNCTGSAEFEKACNCIFKSDILIKTLLTLRDSVVTCMLQTILHSEISDILKCDDF